jgi:two-component system response regulator YesN
LERILNIDLTTIKVPEQLTGIFVGSIAVLVEKIHQLNPSSGDNEIVDQICKYVLENIDDSITVKGMAEALFLHRSYLSEVFKQRTGKMLSEYITMVKIERAKKLLDDGELLSYQIARQLGYQDVDYFGRIFKKFTGVTPSRYKEQAKKD